MLALSFELDDFLLREQLVAAIGGHLIELLQPLYRLLHRDPIGKQSTQPPLIDVEHPATLRFFGNRVLRLALSTHEQHNAAIVCKILHKLRCLFEHLQGLLQVDDVDPVALSEDVLLHLGIPALGLMPEVDARFEQLLHGDVSQLTSLFGLHPALTLRLPRIAIPVPAPRGSGRIEHLKNRRSSLVVSRQPTAVANGQRRRTNDRIYRFEYWKRFL